MCEFSLVFFSYMPRSFSFWNCSYPSICIYTYIYIYMTIYKRDGILSQQKAVPYRTEFVTAGAESHQVYGFCFPEVWTSTFIFKVIVNTASRRFDVYCSAPVWNHIRCVDCLMFFTFVSHFQLLDVLITWIIFSRRLYFVALVAALATF